MFALAILIGIYSYLILDLAFLNILYKNNVYLISFAYLAIIFFIYRKSIKDWISAFPPRGLASPKRRAGMTADKASKIVKDKLLLLLSSLFIIQALVNFIGALGPELSFDALWYHLTFPKLYLSNHSIVHISGGHFYYSYMPKLIEMVYTSAIAMHSEILAKLIHFSFGILSSVIIYKSSRRFFSARISLITTVIFYSNLVVSWESITAYRDLGRTFFEILALWSFIKWTERGKIKYFLQSAVMIGLAITTQVLAFGSLSIFLILISYVLYVNKNSLYKIFAHLLIYSSVALFIPLPWFVFAFINTGNPIYPFFTNTYKVPLDLSLFNPVRLLSDSWLLLVKAADPISPIYLISLPFIILFFKKFKFEIKLIAFYSFLAFIIWYFTPRTGGGRYILPYLPAFSILVGAVINEIWGIRKIGKMWGKLFISLVIIIALVSIVYRGLANKKYIPVILGIQSKQAFLSNNLNFSYGDFYDTDGFFETNIKPNEKVLLYGFHNLYYADFNFIDSSFVKNGDKFKFIATQNSKLPERFRNWNLIYSNLKTQINVYSLGGKEWVY